MKHPYGRGETPLVMGILNLTPDSFSDGGRWNDLQKALDHAFDMIEQGAAIIDVGAESTRPGSIPVPQEEEWARLEPVLKELIPSVDVPVSVDTVKPYVADRCISLGASMINDVNGFRWKGMFEACAGSGVDIVISHMYGTYGDIHRGLMGPSYRKEIKSFIDGQVAKALDAGIPDGNIIVDPGIGFGKTAEQNMSLAEDSSFLKEGHRLLIGVSRKRFIRELFPDTDVDVASARVSKMSAEFGADIVRVHNVAATVSELGF